MYYFLLLVHLLICLGLIGVVLIQSGKGGGLAGGAFGGSAQTVFGGRGATDFVTRATMILGAAFFLTSLVLALMSTGGLGRTSRSLIQGEARKAAAGAPGQLPAAPGSAPSRTGAAPPAGTTPPAGATQKPPPGATTPPPGGGGR